MRKTRRVYLDHAAATPLDAEVRAVMSRYMKQEFGNPSAIHAEGVSARRLLTLARRGIAQALFAHPDEIIFTGSGTEANNLALQGTLQALESLGHPMSKSSFHVITTTIEHPSVLGVCRAMEKRGIAVSYAGVDTRGIISLGEFQKALLKETVFISIMYANNEIGTIQPIREIMKVVRAWRKTHNTPFPYVHTDACQAANYLPLHVERLGIDLMTLNGGKIYGPKGVGALYVRRGVPIASQMYGGGQEGGMRSGTENVIGIMGFAKALEVTERIKEKESRRLTVLRDDFIRSLLKKIPDSELNGDSVQRLPNNIHISIPGVESEQLIIELDAKGIAASAKSACKSMDEEPSHVIMALREGKKAISFPNEKHYTPSIMASGKNVSETASGVRLTLGRGTTKKDITYVLGILPKIVEKLQSTQKL